MKMFELRGYIDVLEEMQIELQSLIKEHEITLYENEGNTKVYLDMLNNLRDYFPHNIKNGNRYFVVQLIGIPVGSMVLIKYTSEVTFIEHMGDKLKFRTASMKEVVFPSTESIHGDQYSNILITDNKDTETEIISFIKLSLSDWIVNSGHIG